MMRYAEPLTRVRRSNIDYGAEAASDSCRFMFRRGLLRARAPHNGASVNVDAAGSATSARKCYGCGRC